MFFKIGVLKKTPTQVPSCEISKIFKNTFFHRRPRVAASEKQTPIYIREKKRILDNSGARAATIKLLSQKMTCAY